MLGVDGHAAFDVLHEEITADGNDHVRLQQVYDGVKVWGSDIVVHSDGENVTGVTARCSARSTVSTSRPRSPTPPR